MVIGRRACACRTPRSTATCTNMRPRRATCGVTSARRNDFDRGPGVGRPRFTVAPTLFAEPVVRWGGRAVPAEELAPGRQSDRAGACGPPAPPTAGPSPARTRPSGPRPASRSKRPASDVCYYFVQIASRDIQPGVVVGPVAAHVEDRVNELGRQKRFRGKTQALRDLGFEGGPVQGVERLPGGELRGRRRSSTAGDGVAHRARSRVGPSRNPASGCGANAAGARPASSAAAAKRAGSPNAGTVASSRAALPPRAGRPRPTVRPPPPATVSAAGAGDSPRVPARRATRTACRVPPRSSPGTPSAARPPPRARRANAIRRGVHLRGPGVYFRHRPPPLSFAFAFAIAAFTVVSPGLHAGGFHFAS